VQDKETYRLVEYRGENLDEAWVLTIDSNTHEVLKEIQAKKYKSVSNYFDEGEFFTMHRRMCNMLKQKKKYSNLTFRLLFELLSRVERNNRISTFTQADLAQVLDSHQQHICTSLKVLKDDNVIQKINRDWYLSPQFVRFIIDEMPKFEAEAKNSES
jgi:hypothetical protein